MQHITLDINRYQRMLQQAATLGAHIAMQHAGLPVREYYTRTEMQRKHGRGIISRLIAEGKLTPHKITDDEHTRIVYSETEFLQQII